MKQCVLVVDDDPFILMDAVDIVQQAGFDVVEARNADEAISQLEANDGISILLTDIEMPGSMDGIRLAHAVRFRWPPFRIIIVSGRVRPDAGQLPEAALFVAKPFQPREIVDALAVA